MPKKNYDGWCIEDKKGKIYHDTFGYKKRNVIHWFIELNNVLVDKEDFKSSGYSCVKVRIVKAKEKQ